MQKFWRCGRYQLELGLKTYVMGIVNVTPDSFSGDGRLGEAAISRALQMVAEGADLLDVGAESTRPGAAKIDVQKELERILPVVEALSERTGVPISVDTTKAEVAQHAVAAGASIINDISAGTFDDAMLSTLAPLDCGVVLMHLRGTPQAMQPSQKLGGDGDLIAEVLDFWQSRLQAAQAAGIENSRLCFDAGFGFGKSVEENLEIVRRGRELADFGFPTLSALSRKSTIGKISDDAPVEDRLFGTAALTALAIQNGAEVIRVHDVREMAQVARVTDALSYRSNVPALSSGSRYPTQ